MRTAIRWTFIVVTVTAATWFIAFAHWTVHYEAQAERDGMLIEDHGLVSSAVTRTVAGVLVVEVLVVLLAGSAHSARMMRRLCANPAPELPIRVRRATPPRAHTEDPVQAPCRSPAERELGVIDPKIAGACERPGTSKQVEGLNGTPVAAVGSPSLNSRWKTGRSLSLNAAGPTPRSGA